jgi:hypothetical protein
LEIGAEIAHRANSMIGTAGVADLTAQADNVHMGGTIHLRSEYVLKPGMSLLCIHFLRAKSEAARDTVYMGIHGKGRLA